MQTKEMILVNKTLYGSWNLKYRNISVLVCCGILLIVPLFHVKVLDTRLTRVTEAVNVSDK
jgi:hypothetical protein